ncbi:MAG: hypothetical protein D3922_02715 [Candidatus Electrothrix sp. AR1]|nr:hypothetical protein [Candidatus Electrothrix sp. AR1]
MFIKKILPLFVPLFLCCRTSLSPVENSNEVRITVLQMNDVYEVDSVNGGKEGGLARVASLRDMLLQRNPDTLTVLAGDLFSPSALGTAPYKDGCLNGRQIVATMNALGLDYCSLQVTRMYSSIKTKERTGGEFF